MDLSGLRCGIVTIAAALLVAGCAVTATNPADPWEGFNRKVFAFNDALDRYAIKPAAEGYRAVTPLPARTNVANFFGNLDDLWIGANNLMQGKGHEGMSDLGRFLINSTIGILGFFDVASELGIEKHDEDFGQTLGWWGVNGGPYLVLPFFGPRTVRDTGGLIVDSLTSPVSRVDDIPVRNSMKGLRVISDRTLLLGAEKTLEEATLDKYSYLRDFYLQRRRNLIFDGNPPDDEDETFSALENLNVSAIGFAASRQMLLIGVGRTPAQ